jgi:hypothetical protein
MRYPAVVEAMVFYKDKLKNAVLQISKTEAYLTLILTAMEFEEPHFGKRK